MDPKPLSAQEITNITKESLRQADVIIDGLVVSDGDRIYLKPIKVWKGKLLRRYYIENYWCGVILPPGDKVRALLEGDRSGFIMMSPLRGREMDTKLYDKVIDNYLGKARPAGFQNGSGERFAPPIKRPH